MVRANINMFHKNKKQKATMSKKANSLARPFGKTSKRVIIGLCAIVLGFSTSTIIVNAVSCSSISECNSKISNLNQDNAQNKARISDLEDAASSYNDEINRLAARIASVQSSISANQAKRAHLEKKIEDYQAKIAEQKVILGDMVRTMYVDGNMSNIEMLATSKNLSDYVDKKEYQNVIQTKIQSTLSQIQELKSKVEAQKGEVEALLKDLASQKAELNSARAKQTRLLAYNQSQRDQFNADIRANNSKISSLRSQQIKLNLLLSGGGVGVVAGNPDHGGYPAKWDYPVRQDSKVDSWGMYNRECVSYTAWKVFQTFKHMPYWGGHGNANRWPANAVADGIPTGHTPKAQSVAISMSGYYGHAMWVEAVNADGSIWVSQYNYDWNGHYSEMPISAARASNLTYIYFR